MGNPFSHLDEINARTRAARLARIMAEIQNVREKVEGYTDKNGIGAYKILRWLDDIESA